MDPLGILCNDMVQDAMRPRHRIQRQNTLQTIAAYFRRQAAAMRPTAQIASKSGDVDEGLPRMTRTPR